ncbi:NAD(P)-dependent dehydrogenase, short-chain alcohol dehydrogenase family [Duganella sp. CF402]|uniref:SDR family NAD(P)-dependent oxidoreductase n=1 Tax=unclassified Duganella TaxID=2636909 RepID=UPI0008CB1F85|nr:MULTISPECIES: SDR family oxidoreductase [unclassified Duganella]RZT09806.1 NAD(P)-dependent dehydrogenase (short-subunit alcohol dehydrogenase family) [Duganella sp. BK701]SEL42076.1 NAD(P)-dependent dehydrogenase, short-chain alcohol dehydrogenase family [Duganella sp. CF402]
MGQPLVYASYPDLADKRVLITGGGTGIGAGIVDAFVKQGAQVFFIDIAAEASKELAESLKGGKHAPVFYHCDLTDLKALSSVIAQIEKDYGAIEVLINNAANDHRHQVQDVTEKYWDDSLAVNLRHQFFCAQAVAPGMKKAGGGVILNFGSISWHLALPDLTLYMTAKAAIEGLTRGLARDLGKDGIRVNCVVPGSVLTPKQKALWHDEEGSQAILASQVLPQTVETEDIAAMVLFLSSDNARRCSGRDYFVDAGWYGA